jgi:hypothetical protein
MVKIGFAAPTIAKENIPADIPFVVRNQIERLYSADPKERKTGAYYLGEMREKSIPAIPFLIGILHEGNYCRVLHLGGVLKDFLAIVMMIGTFQ